MHLSSFLSFFHKDRSIARKDFNRWLIPPAALAIHLSIGQVYSFSVFNIPLTQVLGVDRSAPGDWPLTWVTFIFSLAFTMLGLSAALFGKWLERVGPRAAMACSALCFSSGFLISALGVKLHEISLLYIGYGVIGGIGLGIGYISPVSTLMKWFPDRPGMATGMAIMGFGGGALIGSPLAVVLMDRFRSATSNGVFETFLTMGVIYLLAMTFGMFRIRVPAPGWVPPKSKRGAESKESTVLQNAVTRDVSRDVTVESAMKTPQFWLLWVVLCTNVTAGIAVLSQASPMIQEIFKGRVGPAEAAGFVGLLSLFNLGGRFVWSSLSDYLGRKRTYTIYFGVGIALYALIPLLGRIGSIPLWVAAFCVIISMYGGGFSTIPAYLKDEFGLLNVGAIHGRLLTAWSTAGIIGPTLIAYLRQAQLKAGIPLEQSYSTTMYVMVGVLLIGLIANRKVGRVDEKFTVGYRAA